MHQKNKSWPDAFVQSSITENVIGRPGESVPETNASSSPRPDFLSPEFNIIDDLDDNTGNYRTFQSLEGIVTSDMRHHEERKESEALPLEKRDESREDNEEECSAGVTEGQSPSLPLTVVSKGRTLIICPDITRARDYGKLLNAQGLACTICIPACNNSDLSFTRTDPFPVIEAETVSVSGSFGGFTVTAGANGDKANMSSLPGDETGVFDLVLDLQPKPSFTGKQLPLGYYAPGDAADGIDEALAEMPEMRGRFSKPQFAVFFENRCLHSRSRLRICEKCLEICPVAAITSADRKIAIDPYLCQGCGGCSLVCPTDAIQMHAPQQEDMLSALAGLLSDAAAGKSTPSELVLYDLGIGNKAFHSMAATAEDYHVFFGIEEIGRVGLEVLLIALAYGAGRVTLLCDPERPVQVRQALERETETGKEILQGLDLPTDSIRFIIHSPEKTDLNNKDFWHKAESSGHFKSLIQPDPFHFGHDKRTLTRLAAQHLSRVAGLRNPSIPLQADATYGEITIDAAACSLCMACVGSCPAEALKSSGEEPCISFAESLCHQCGLCAASCPENAIQLRPRLLCDIEASDIPTVLRKVEPFKCIECGEPFTSHAMISRMQEKLSGHWMYSSDRQIRRLKMCRTCRTRDALTAGDFRS